jgi:hypothetical protein
MDFLPLLIQCTEKDDPRQEDGLAMMEMKKSTEKSWLTRLALPAAGLIFSAGLGMASAQYGPPPPRDLPPADPGYSEYYHEDNAAPNYAARVGYHDGWADGRHDKETGHSFRPTQDDHYKNAPEYGHPPMGRKEYKDIYRQAYVHGYERGYRG